MQHPGEFLKARFLDPLGVTPYRLAKGIGVDPMRISQIVRGKRSITADTATRLGAFFGVPPKWFMDLQVDHDLSQVASRADCVEKLPGRFWVRPTGAEPLGPAPSARGNTLRVDPAFRERVRAQAALSPERRKRSLTAVEYADGMKAMVGNEEDV